MLDRREFIGGPLMLWLTSSVWTPDEGDEPVIDPQQLLWFVIVPVLQYLDMDSPSARALVLGTGLTESGLARLSQGSDRSPGPGLGIYQMQKATYYDIWDRTIVLDPVLMQRVQWMECLHYHDGKRHLQLIDNLSLATAMCRIHYWRCPDPLPHYRDTPGLAAYWKKHYNTTAGKGKPENFIAAARSLERIVFDI